MSLESLIKEVKKLSLAEREELVRAVMDFDVKPLGNTMDEDMISKLIDVPLPITGFRPLTRDEANAR